MDTFMEKLAEKFTAQEMIKANEAAEKQEMDRLQVQVQEYTQCLERMKQICAEMEQTADAARNKVESVQVDTDSLKTELLKIWEDMQAADARKDEAAQTAGQADEQAMADVAERMTAQMTAQVADHMESLKSAQSTDLEELKSVMSQQISGLQHAMDEKMAALAAAPQGVQAADLRSMQAEQMENLKGLQNEQMNQMRTMQQDQLDNLRSVLKAQLSGLKDGQNQSEFILSELESQRNALDAKIAEIKTGVEEQLGGSNEFVHRECVKVYRNVQAVIGDENKKQTENLDYTFNPMKDKLKKIFTISVVALAASVAGVILQILSLLHIF